MQVSPKAPKGLGGSSMGHSACSVCKRTWVQIPSIHIKRFCYCPCMSVTPMVRATEIERFQEFAGRQPSSRFGEKLCINTGKVWVLEQDTQHFLWPLSAKISVYIQGTHAPTPRKRIFFKRKEVVLHPRLNCVIHMRTVVFGGRGVCRGCV